MIEIRLGEWVLQTRPRRWSVGNVSPDMVASIGFVQIRVLQDMLVMLIHRGNGLVVWNLRKMTTETWRLPPSFEHVLVTRYRRSFKTVVIAVCIQEVFTILVIFQIDVNNASKRLPKRDSPPGFRTISKVAEQSRVCWKIVDLSSHKYTLYSPLI